jgi:hypothetical protein
VIPIAAACERVRESALRKCVNSDEYALHLVTMVQSAHDVATPDFGPPQRTDANRNREEGAIDEVFPATWTLDANGGAAPEARRTRRAPRTAVATIRPFVRVDRQPLAL